MNEVVPPGGSVSGRDNPLTLKPAPVTLEEEMVALELPVLVTVTVWLVLLPTITSLKSMLLGLALNCTV